MTNNDRLIEQMIFGSLQGNELKNFQSMLNEQPDLAQELKFQQELKDAILESEVSDFRIQLKAIAGEPMESNHGDERPQFDLSHHLNQSKISKTTHAEIKLNGNSLQHIHLENHKKTLTERRHKISSGNHHYAYLRNQNLNDQELWKEITLSINDDDVAELRTNLNQIAAADNSAYSDFEIDQFRDGELDALIANEIKELSETNPQFAARLKLHHEIDEAISESDLLELRNSISEIIDEEQSIGFEEIKRIDEYLLNYLSQDEQEFMEEQLANDLRLKKETKLNREINEAILEEDVQHLRASLIQLVKTERTNDKHRKLIPASINSSKAKIFGAAASLAAIITTGSILLNHQQSNTDDLYEKYYQPYESTGLYRNSSSLAREMNGVDLYNQKNYLQALEQFSAVLRENPEHPMCNFYAGLSYQELDEYRKAIGHYQNVIDEKDNLFIEQAEWYMALCYLKTDNQARAYSIFNQILDKNGYYSKDAQEIMKKTK